MKKVLFLIAVVIVFVSCSSDDGTNDRRELNANRQLWEASQIKDYSWNERLSCFCGGVLDRNVIVINGAKHRVNFDETTLPEGVTYEDIFENSRTVEEAFDFIESLLSQDVASLFIEYDETYGFPTNIGIDYNQDAIDDEIAYVYSNFGVIIVN